MKKTLLLVFIAVLIGGVKAAVDHELQVQLNAQLQNTLPDGGVTYQHASASLSGGVMLENITIKRPDIPLLEIARLTLPHAYRFANGLPATIQVKLDAVRLSLPDDAPDMSFLFKAAGYGDYYLSVKDLTRLGYGKLRADAELTLRHDTDGQRLHLDIHLHGGNIGSWQLNLTVDKVAHLSPSLKWQNLPLKQADLYLRETAFLNRGLGYLAKRQQQTPAELRHALADKVRQNLSMLRLNLDDDSMNALSALLRDGTPLHIQAAPPEPVPLQVLRRYLPMQWPSLLGLRIREGHSKTP
jgi:hypothetical protein